MDPETTNHRCVHVMQGLRVGGMERGVLQLVRMSRAAGHDDRIIVFDEAPGKTPEHLDHGQIPVSHVARRSSGLDVGFVSRLIAAMSRQRPRIVHARNDTALFYCAAAISLLRRPPILIATLHNAPAHPTSGSRLATLWASQKAKTLTVVSTELGERLRLNGWVTSYSTIHNGVDIDKYKPTGSRGNLREELGISKDAEIVAHIGRFDENKRQEDLLLAFQRVVALNPHPHLVFIGDGPCQHRLRTLAAKISNVHFLGTRADIASLLRSIDISVICSDHEGMPRSLLEAMATECAVIATEVGGVREIFQGKSEAGILVPPRNPDAIAFAIRKLLDAEYRRRCGQLAREIIETRFSLTTCWRRYESIYADSLHNG